jgi:hypothetical protein
MRVWESNTSWAPDPPPLRGLTGYASADKAGPGPRTLFQEGGTGPNAVRPARTSGVGRSSAAGTAPAQRNVTVPAASYQSPGAGRPGHKTAVIWKFFLDPGPRGGVQGVTGICQLTRGLDRVVQHLGLDEDGDEAH